MTEEYEVVITPEAYNDLRSIYSYIAMELMAPAAAKNTVAMIRKSIISLEQMPQRHELTDIEPWRQIGMRRMPVGNYLVFYLVHERTARVIVDRIFYGGRDIESVAGDITDRS